MSELKPVRCGCGGEANIHKDDSTYGQMPIYTVSCSSCGMRSGRRSTEAEAIIAWNRAMGITNERAIEHLQSTGWMEDHDYQMVEMGKEMAREDIPMEYFENGGI